MDESNNDEQHRTLDTRLGRIYFNKYDVICGRNKLARSYSANKTLRTIIKNHSYKYQNALTRLEKSRITHDIINMIHDNGGRFLLMDGDKSNPTLEEVHYNYMYEKVSHALRSAKISTSKPKKIPSSPITGNIKQTIPTTQSNYSTSSTTPVVVNPFEQAVVASEKQVMDPFDGYNTSARPTLANMIDERMLQTILSQNQYYNQYDPSVTTTTMNYRPEPYNNNISSCQYSDNYYYNSLNNNTSTVASMPFYISSTTTTNNTNDSFIGQPHLVSPPETPITPEKNKVASALDKDDIKRLLVENIDDDDDDDNDSDRTTTKEQQKEKSSNGSYEIMHNNLMKSQIGHFDYFDDSEDDNNNNNNNYDVDDYMMMKEENATAEELENNILNEGLTDFMSQMI